MSVLQVKWRISYDKKDESGMENMALFAYLTMWSICSLDFSFQLDVLFFAAVIILAAHTKFPSSVIGSCSSEITRHKMLIDRIRFPD